MRVVVFGCSGPVGVGLMERLAREGASVRGVSRTGRSEKPAGAEVVAGDAGDEAEAIRLAAGADVVFGTMGLPYPEWPARWPPIVRGLIAAAERSGARLVFADNVYAYGPQQVALREDLPLTSYGRKPALRAQMTRWFLEAHQAGRARVALVRASDFYGPRVRNSLLGERVFARLMNGKPAQFVGRADQPHAFTYVPDFVHALCTIARAEDVAFGQAWHVPNAPAVTPREVVERVAELVGQPARLSTLPAWAVAALGAFNPIMRELREMTYQFDRPFVVDHAKYAARFGETFTPLDEGLRATVAWYRAPRQIP